MKWSFKIARVFGIDLRVHITFFLIIFYAAFVWAYIYGEGWSGAVYGAVIIAVLFVCVVIHEFCHSLMAIHYGGEVSSITLLPIGGVSMIKSLPDDPRKEFWMTLVGPLSNLVIAAILFPIIYLVPNPVDGTFGAFRNADVLVGISFQGFIAYLFLINVLLAVFNLIPAFPLDGGRVLRSLLAGHMSYVQATRIAVITGQVFAFLLGLIGVITLNVILIIIAIFIYMGAEAEGSGAEMKNVLAKFRVGEAVTGNVVTLKQEQTLGEVVSFVLHGFQEDFPVVDGDLLVGILTRQNLINGLHRIGAEARVSQVMERQFPVVQAEEPFSKVYEKMNESGIKAVPVMQDDRLLGMVTLEHLSEVFMLLTSAKNPLPH